MGPARLARTEPANVVQSDPSILAVCGQTKRTGGLVPLFCSLDPGWIGAASASATTSNSIAGEPEPVLAAQPSPQALPPASAMNPAAAVARGSHLLPSPRPQSLEERILHGELLVEPRHVAILRVHVRHAPAGIGNGSVLCFYESLMPHLGGSTGASSSSDPKPQLWTPAVSVAPWPPALQALPPRAASNCEIRLSSRKMKPRPSL
ncbi:hypothetical protein ZWY2020_048907 [Hordeum vulgare]|nr:hypothetical protein ZWY2020_048907 [Hordeum vulgare]